MSLHSAITISILALLALSGSLILDCRYESHIMGTAGSPLEFLYFVVATYLFWCPPASCASSASLWLWTWIQLILELLAAFAPGFQLRGKKPRNV